MSLKIELKIDTLDKPIVGYVSNDCGYAIRDMLIEAIESYQLKKQRHLPKSQAHSPAETEQQRSDLRSEIKPAEKKLDSAGQPNQNFGVRYG